MRRATTSEVSAGPVWALTALPLLWAQADGLFAPPGGPGSLRPAQGPSLDLPLRLGLFALVVLLASLFWFRIAFEWMLRRKSDSVWPRTAYGRAWFGFVTTVGGLLLVLFWRYLVLDRLIPGVVVEGTFVRDWLVRAALLLIILMLDVYSWFLVRSPAR